MSIDPFTGKTKVSFDFDPKEAETTLGGLFEYLQQSGKVCYIAIDEFQQIATYPEKGVEALLRSYAQFCPNVHFVFSGSKQHLMNDIFNTPSRPFYRSTEKMTLGTIDEPSYYTFAQQWMRTIGCTMSEEVFHHLYVLFEGHTYYMQYVLNKLYEERLTTVTRQDLEQCVGKIVATEEDGFQLLYTQLTSNQAALLRAIANEGCVTGINASSFISRYNLKGTSSINRALDYLIDKEYVHRQEGGYVVYDRFMSIWLRNL